MHYVCAAGGVMLHFRRSSPAGVWTQAAAFGAAAAYSGPCMIETLNELGDELDAGPLQLFVETGAQIEHWYLPVASPWLPNPTWNRVTVFGADVRRVIGALQNSGSRLEVCVERTDGRYQVYTRAGFQWNPGPLI